MSGMFCFWAGIMLNDNPELSENSYDRLKFAVWEITLKCNLACGHCGSRAGEKRPDELSTGEALNLVHQMADLGITDIALIGGEAYLRPDWLEIAREITRCGMRANVTTGGYGISQETARRMKEASIHNVSVSVDGMAKTHNRLRGKIDSWQQCFRSIEHLRNAGLNVGCNTQINKLTAPELPMLYQKLVDAGAKAWQIQLTVPMGNAADNHEILLQPFELLDLYPLLAYLSKRGRQDDFMIQPGNNIGYFGPYERLLRSPLASSPKYAFWRGCNAGLGTIGIEADGKIKACPSLPSDQYTGGNIRDRSLHDIYHHSKELRFNDVQNEEQATAHLWGDCATCEYKKICRAGCNWTAHVFFAKRGNNPYCHHRAIKKAVRGRMETFVMRKPASGLPFDHGEFELIEQQVQPVNPLDERYFSLQRTQFPQAWLDTEPDLVDKLLLEKSLNMIQYVKAGIVPVEESPWFDKEKLQAIKDGIPLST